MTSAADIKDELFASAIPGKREVLSRFFKTGEGEYGEGDLFIGVPVPAQRSIVKQYFPMDMDEIAILLSSEFHECRMTGLLFLVRLYEKSDEEQKKAVFSFYLSHTHYINNWDLVDLSAPQIVGNYLLNKKSERKLLKQLAKSKSLWERRIAIVSTLTLIKKNVFIDTLEIAQLLSNDKEDLIHKATGWMLREVGKIDYETEFNYLKEHYKQMNRTTLRYAIERFDGKTKNQFLLGRI